MISTLTCGAGGERLLWAKEEAGPLLTCGSVPLALRMANLSLPISGCLLLPRASSICCWKLFFLACMCSHHQNNVDSLQCPDLFREAVKNCARLMLLVQSCWCDGLYAQPLCRIDSILTIPAMKLGRPKLLAYGVNVVATVWTIKACSHTHPKGCPCCIPNCSPHADADAHCIPLVIKEVSEGKYPQGSHQHVLQVACHTGCQGVIVPRAHEGGVIYCQPKGTAEQQCRLQAGQGSVDVSHRHTELPTPSWIASKHFISMPGLPQAGSSTM